MTDEEEILKKTIGTYNKYRAPTAHAELFEYSEEEFRVSFEGPFCRSCCMDEYFIDLIYELKSSGLETKLKKFYPISAERFVAEYEISD